MPRTRFFVAVLVVFGLVALSMESVQEKARGLEAHTRLAYDPPVVEITAKMPLPELSWQEAMTKVTGLLVAPLPKGATVAATEVGYMGSHAEEVNVIDMAGLNDTAIALHGFNAKALLARRPDLIWMPHTDYSYMRGEIFSDPALLTQYDVYAGAANFGLAVRRDSSYRLLLDKQMQLYWHTTYPGTTMEQYRVRSVRWSGKSHVVIGE